MEPLLAACKKLREIYRRSLSDGYTVDDEDRATRAVCYASEDLEDTLESQAEDRGS